MPLYLSPLSFCSPVVFLFLFPPHPAPTPAVWIQLSSPLPTYQESICSVSSGP